MGPYLATSRYNFRIPLSEGYALFNASTGGVLRLQGPDAAELAALLSGVRTLVPLDALGEELTTRLRRNGFLIDSDFDEVAEIRERYWAARGNAPIVLLLTTTMDCNLGCYYCYESRSSDALQITDVEEIVAIARERLAWQSKRSLHVDWYGGEPLMNLEFLEKTSHALQAFCVAEGVRYHASIISNGTHWPAEIASFVARHKIRQAQISFDGLRANHDRRRRYRTEYRPTPDATSFDRVVELVDQCCSTRVWMSATTPIGGTQKTSLASSTSLQDAAGLTPRSGVWSWWQSCPPTRTAHSSCVGTNSALSSSRRYRTLPAATEAERPG